MRSVKKVAQFCLAVSVFSWAVVSLLQTMPDKFMLERRRTSKNSYAFSKTGNKIGCKTPPAISQNAHETTNKNAGISKVLFVTYSRSGSSFLGELLNRNKKAFYHFEPLLGAYSALYGIPLGMKSMSFFRYKNGSDRWPPEFEYQVIARNIIDWLSCDVERVPVGILQDNFVMSLNKEKKYGPYKTCLKQTQKRVRAKGNNEQNTTKTGAVNASKCTKHLAKQCGSFFNNDREFKCFEKIFNTKYPSEREIVRGQLPSLVPKAANRTEKDYFSLHNNCILKAKAASDSCLGHLKNQCTGTTLRGAKIIRMRMENIATILENDPSIKIIHYFRDPRGLELSRSVGMRGDKQKEMIKDAEKTCRKMRQDIAARKGLEDRYPDNFKVLRYEDLAIDTVQVAKEIYGFIGSDLPKEVLDWLAQNTQKSRGKQSGLSTSGRNSTATALRWKSKLPQSTASEISRICQDIIQELKFES